MSLAKWAVRPSCGGYPALWMRGGEMRIYHVNVAGAAMQARPECAQGARVNGSRMHPDGTGRCSRRNPAHSRMRLVVRDWFDDWIDPTSSVPWSFESVREPRAGPYEQHAVSTRANNIRNDDLAILRQDRGNRLAG